MKFEELQSLWNCQDNEPSFGLDTDAVLDTVRQRSNKLAVEASLFEMILMGSLIFVGLVSLKDPLLQGHDMHQIVTAVLCFGSAAFIWRGRHIRRTLEVQFDDSLLGCIEKSIAQLNYKTSQMRGYLWFCIVPLTVSVGLGYFQANPAKTIWFLILIIPLFVFMMALSYFVMRWENNRFSLPQLAELEAQRAKLLSTEEPVA